MGRKQITEVPALEPAARLWLAEECLYSRVTQEAEFHLWVLLVLIEKEVVVSYQRKWENSLGFTEIP